MAAEVLAEHPPAVRRITRRALLRRICGAGMGGVVSVGLGAAYARDVEPFWPAIERHNMEFPQLAPALAGLRLLQLSDLHLCPGMGTDYLRGQLHRCMRLGPDVIVLTGDYITCADARFIDPLTALLRTLRPRLGTYAVLGNHDWAVYHSRGAPGAPFLAQRMEQALADAGVSVLRNRVQRLEHAGAALQLVGLDDLWSGYCDPAQALREVDPNLPCIVLAHNPDTLSLLKDKPGDWVLCGHTHGGQVRIPLYGAVFLPLENRRLDAGRFEVAGKRVYVNRGIGFVRQVRFNCRPEITLFTLTRRA